MPVGRLWTFEEALGVLISGQRRPFGAAPESGGRVSVAARQRAAGQEAAVALPPWIQMPQGGLPFSQSNVAAVVLPAIGAQIVVVTVTVPRGMNGVINAIANQTVGAGWIEGSGSVIWRLQADGLPFRGYDNILSTIGTTAAPGNLTDSPIRIYENQLIELVLVNVSLAPVGQPLLGLLRGHFYPIEQEMNY